MLFSIAMSSVQTTFPNLNLERIDGSRPGGVERNCSKVVVLRQQDSKQRTVLHIKTSIHLQFGCLEITSVFACHDTKNHL